jgi:hypothetical protein
MHLRLGIVVFFVACATSLLSTVCGFLASEEQTPLEQWGHLRHAQGLLFYAQLATCAAAAWLIPKRPLKHLLLPVGLAAILVVTSEIIGWTVFGAMPIQIWDFVSRPLR